MAAVRQWLGSLLESAPTSVIDPLAADLRVHIVVDGGGAEEDDPLGGGDVVHLARTYAAADATLAATLAGGGDGDGARWHRVLWPAVEGRRRLCVDVDQAGGVVHGLAADTQTPTPPVPPSLAHQLALVVATPFSPPRSPDARAPRRPLLLLDWSAWTADERADGLVQLLLLRDARLLAGDACWVRLARGRDLPFEELRRHVKEATRCRAPPGVLLALVAAVAPPHPEAAVALFRQCGQHVARPVVLVCLPPSAVPLLVVDTPLLVAWCVALRTPSRATGLQLNGRAPPPPDTAHLQHAVHVAALAWAFPALAAAGPAVGNEAAERAAMQALFERERTAAGF